MTYTVYILRSMAQDRFYIGYTQDINNRLQAHNAGKVRSTKAYRPWEIIYTEKYSSKEEAYVREMQIKSYKGGRAFRKLVDNT